MSLSRHDLNRIVGKTIKSIVICESDRAEPRRQLILVFTDGTYYEFYGADIHSTNGPDKGDEADAVRYLAGTGGKITHYP